MIDLEKSKLEAEALAKLRKEQYFREVLAGELGVMIDQHFASKEPLVKTIPIFVRAVEDLALTAREILDYLEGVENDRMKLMKELEAKPITAAEEAPSTAAEPEPEKEATPRVLSKDIISDTELDEQYFKHGKTVKEIAQKYGIKPDGLYKRIEAMKAQRQDIAKECVSSQQ